MIGIDTNILLRWLIDESIWPDDAPGQRQASADLLSQPGGRFHVNAVVLSEALWVLTKPMRQPLNVVLSVLSRMLAAPNIEIQSRPAVEATVARLSVEKGPLHDTLIVEFNRLAGCDYTVTFDRKASELRGYQPLDLRG